MNMNVFTKIEVQGCLCACVCERERERFILNLITPETFEETSNNENDCEGND